MFFLKNREQEGFCLEIGTSMWGEIKKECRRMNIVEVLCIHSTENGKMRPVETVSGMREWRIKESNGGAEFNCDIL
jgi:hypothetical protein